MPRWKIRKIEGVWYVHDHETCQIGAYEMPGLFPTPCTSRHSSFPEAIGAAS